jgi:hypothetical protein
MADTENATVTMKHPDGTVETQELPPDDYMILCGPQRYIANVQSYPGKGTVVVTIKTERGVAS